MANYIERTIDSVLSQGYPNLEYIIIDGGSTDGTTQIIEKYQQKIAYYISEPDDGMYDALEKGFRHATGDIYAWLNADDLYFPWTLFAVNDIFSRFDDIKWIEGKHAFLQEDGNIPIFRPKCSAKTRKDISSGWCRGDVLGNLQQESMFWRKELYEESNGIDISYKYAGDFELWIRFAGISELTLVDMYLSAFRQRSKSLSTVGYDNYLDEIEKACRGKKQFPNALWKYSRRNAPLLQFLRLIRFRKTTLLIQNPHTHQLDKTQVFMNDSNFSFSHFLHIALNK